MEQPDPSASDQLTRLEAEPATALRTPLADIVRRELSTDNFRVLIYSETTYFAHLTPSTRVQGERFPECLIPLTLAEIDLCLQRIGVVAEMQERDPELEVMQFRPSPLGNFGHFGTLQEEIVRADAYENYVLRDFQAVTIIEQDDGAVADARDAKSIVVADHRRGDRKIIAVRPLPRDEEGNLLGCMEMSNPHMYTRNSDVRFSADHQATGRRYYTGYVTLRELETLRTLLQEVPVAQLMDSESDSMPRLAGAA